MTAVFAGIMLALMLRFPSVVLHSALDGLQAFSRSVLPILFPYMVFCQLVGDLLSRQTRIPPSIPCALLGWLGGSPTGARLSASLAMRGRLSRRSLYQLSVLCGTVSPMFITGTIGAWADSSRFGLCVLFSHWSGALLCGACYALFSTPDPAPSVGSGASEAPCDKLYLPDAILQSAQAMLVVGGCITLFSVLSAIPSAILPQLHRAPQAVLHAFLEMAGGSYALIRQGWKPEITCCAVSACVSFGGLSILMQNLAFLRPVQVHPLPLVLMRWMHALFSAAFCWLLYPLLCG